MDNNKKIIGARSVVYDDIKFQSLLEVSCYKKLIDSGLAFVYEPTKTQLWSGFKPIATQIYAPRKIRKGKYGKDLEQQTRALIDISYTPDFLVEKGRYRIYFDAKGKENDVYPLKKKMFLRKLEEASQDGNIYYFFEPHSVKQMVQAIEFVQKLE